MQERPVLLLAIASDGRFDDAVRRANDQSQLGAGVDVQFLVNVHEVGGYGPFADAEPVCYFTVRKAVDDVTDDLALAMAQLLIQDRFHSSVWNEVGNAGPVRLVLAPNQGLELIRLILLQQIHVVKLPRMLDGHRHERVFVLGTEDFATGGAGKSQRFSLNHVRHAGTVLAAFLVVTIHANFSDAHNALAGEGEGASWQQELFLAEASPPLETKYTQTPSWHQGQASAGTLLVIIQKRAAPARSTLRDYSRVT